MKRILPAMMLALAAAGCVSVEGRPDPHGALKPGQRLVVAVYPAPGPWIIDTADTKAEAAAKISPIGFFMENVQDGHILSVSQDLQQYLPRPHYGLAVNDRLLAGLRAKISSATVVTAFEAGVAPAQLLEWNKASDQREWRQRYYFPDPDQPAPRDYSRILTLDDALILDVNVSYGTVALEEGRILPQMSADARVYRGDTTRLLWEREESLTDTTSSSTLTEFKIQPVELTGRLEKLAPLLGDALAASFLKAFLVAPSTAPAAAPAPPSAPPPAASAGGLVPMSTFEHLASSAAPAGTPPSTAVAVSSAPVAPPSLSSATLPSPAPAPPTPP